MPSIDNIEYFRRRAAEERAHAARELRPEIRRVHQELAERYAARVMRETAPVNDQ